MKHLDICEIFYSLQGESSYMGMPCIFVRLSGCNLRCSYCDTQYSYQSGKRMHFDTILEQIDKYPAKLVELTGGEPLLQKQSNSFMQLLIEKGYTVLLETNGSLSIGDVPQEVVKILDVKCPGSGEENSFLLANLKLMTSKDELKFVLTSDQDYCYAREFIHKHSLQNKILHFSPVIDLLPAELLAKWILEDGLQVKLSLQLHKILNLR
ncbi:MAG: radical SAM protein [Candidatus Cloacimonadaceae bacterium]|nr:radical SAM protein [Candidatus Cloacimonadaceae bacterium]